MNPELISALEKEWNLHRWTNILLLESLEKLERDLSEQGIGVCRLKGASLLPRIYQDLGERVLSDLDIFVPPGHAQRIENYLQDHNFIHQPVMEFEGSANRKNWSKSHPTGLEISFDVHTETHWRMPQEFYSRVVRDGLGFFRLDESAELLHLIVNWVEQDTCVSFNKMWDIFLVLRSSTLNWSDWFAWAQRLGHERSIRIVQVILRRFFDFQWGLPNSPGAFPGLKIAEAILDVDFLTNPQRSPIKYYALKHLTKDMRRAILYDWLWFTGHTRRVGAKMCLPFF